MVLLPHTSSLSDSTPDQVPHGDEIRLLDLLPGNEDDDIECDIRAVSLKDGEKYEALSYVWGQRASGRIVKVSGSDVEITNNLYASLKHFRNPTTKRALWVDQMCIHQWDNEDKARQVSLMRLIYKSCSQCLIWLGEIVEDSAGYSTTDAKLVLDFIHAAAIAAPLVDLRTVFTDSAEGEGARKAFRSMVMHGNPWWSRIWTVQEIVLPLSASVIWGTLSIPWKTLEQAATNMCAADVLPPFYVEKYARLIENFLYPVRGLSIARTGEGPLNTLQRWRYREATDPRDKVYALMGLFQHMPFPSIQLCSYDISPATLYARVTLDLIRLEKGLRPLIGFRGEPHVTINLPTWALDLTRYNYSNGNNIRHWNWWNHSHRYNKFSACGREPLECASLNDDTILRLTGVFIDRIAEVGQVLGEEAWETLTDDHIVETILSWDALLTRRLITGKIDNGYVGGSSWTGPHASWADAFWRTMLGDLIMREYPVARATGAYLHDFVEFISNKVHNEVYVSISDMVVNQAFFITEKGYIGIGPPNLQVEDEVWVLFGGLVPFILRPDEASRPEGILSNTFSFIGDAYVNGIMDGQAVNDQGRRKTTVMLS